MARVLALGTRLTLTDQGEGWFPLAPAGSLPCAVIGTVERTKGETPFYIVRLEQPLEVQEAATDTPSRFRSYFYSHAVICSRWAGVEIGSEPDVSVYVLLPDSELSIPTTGEACVSLPIRAWAMCRIDPSSVE